MSLPPETYTDWIMGLDLGKAQDYTGFVAAERTAAGQGPFRHGVRLIRRWDLGTSYVAILKDLGGLLAKPPLAGAVLAVDETGVGKAVVDMIRAARLPAVLKPVLITGGHEIIKDGAGWHVPKKELVSTLQVLLQSGRLKVARCPERDTLLKEFQNFRVKVKADTGHETFEAWRERDHDDLVLAVALACWVGERFGRREGNCRPTVFYTEPGTSRFQQPRGRYVAGGVEPGPAS